MEDQGPNSKNVAKICDLENALIKAAAPKDQIEVSFVTEPRVSPALLCLPSTLNVLGWVGGVVGLTLAGLISLYAYNLLSVVLEFHSNHDKTQLRFKDIATHTMGPRWGKYYVAPLQRVLCFTAVVGYTLTGGQSMKFIYLLCNPSGRMELYYFTIMFGVLIVFLVQIPSLHSLRHISLLSLNLCLAFSIYAVFGSIHIGNHRNELNRNHSAKEDQGNRILGAFHAIPIIANSFSSGVFPEIQATMAPPVKKQMFKGLCVTYGSLSRHIIALQSLDIGLLGTRQREPFSLIFWVYLQPMNEMLENKFADPKADQFSGQNIVQRSIFQSMAVMTATSLAAMLGSFGCIPLYFILPMVFYNLTFKPFKLSLILWINTLILGLSLAMAGIGAITSIYQIVSDAKTFHLFANI